MEAKDEDKKEIKNRFAALNDERSVRLEELILTNIHYAVR